MMDIDMGQAQQWCQGVANTCMDDYGKGSPWMTEILRLINKVAVEIGGIWENLIFIARLCIHKM